MNKFREVHNLKGTMPLNNIFFASDFSSNPFSNHLQDYLSGDYEHENTSRQPPMALRTRACIQAATRTVAKPTTAAAAGRNPAASAATTTGTTQAATTAAAISGRGETNMTVYRKLFTMDFGVTSEGGDSKDDVPTAAAPVAATDHPTEIRLRPKSK
jgi:hypothetical protein